MRISPSAGASATDIFALDDNAIVAAEVGLLLFFHLCSEKGPAAAVT